MSQIIIFVIALIVSVIISVIKKKNAQAMGAPAPKRESDAWEDIVAKYEVTSDPVMEEANTSYETSIEDIELIEAEKIRQKRMAKIEERNIKSKIRPIEVKVEVEPDQSPSTRISDIAERFNISDAVIYSEILKPKF